MKTALIYFSALILACSARYPGFGGAAFEGSDESVESSITSSSESTESSIHSSNSISHIELNSAEDDLRNIFQDSFGVDDYVSLETIVIDDYGVGDYSSAETITIDDSSVEDYSSSETIVIDDSRVEDYSSSETIVIDESLNAYYNPEDQDEYLLLNLDEILKVIGMLKMSEEGRILLATLAENSEYYRNNIQRSIEVVASEEIMESEIEEDDYKFLSDEEEY